MNIIERSKIKLLKDTKEHKLGEIVDVTANVAERLIHAGEAEAVVSEPVKVQVESTMKAVHFNDYPSLRFCKIRKGTKKPFEKDWVNKPYTWEEMHEHIGREMNYGVLCGYGGLIIIDSDTVELKEAVEKYLPPSLRVKTGSGGTHDYYICKEVKKKMVLTTDRHFGEVQAMGAQCIGPGSLHPNGNIYELVRDGEIKEITLQELTSVIKPFMQEVSDAEDKVIVELRNYGDSDINSLNITNVMNTLGFKKASGKNEYYGINPWHGSSTGMNTWVNPSKNVGFCFRCNVGINVAQAIALNEKIIHNCGDKLSKENFMKVLDIAQEKYGLRKYKRDPTKKDITDDREEIILPGLGNQCGEFARQIANITKEKKRMFYRPDLGKVVVLKKEQIGATEIEEVTSFKIVTPAKLVTLIEKDCNPGILIKDKETEEMMFREKSMGVNTASIILESDEFNDGLYQIKRIFTFQLPIIYQEKLEIPAFGYDSRFQSWLPPDSPKIRTDMPLESANELIKQIYSEFCFESDQDKINAIALFITPACRGLYSEFNIRTPCGGYIANRERSGKDYCAGITGLVYAGSAVEESPLSTSEGDDHGGRNEELRKKLTAAFISGKKRMHFSNNKGCINNSVFESVLTARTYTDRILGGNQTVEFPNEMEYSWSGNTGIRYTADLANRSRLVKLKLEIEDANARKFNNPDLHGWVVKHRSEILSAVYALIRNWVEKGMPPGKVAFASFPEWARIVGGIMETAGYDSPCKSDLDRMDLGGDDETMEMKRLFEICSQKFGVNWVSRTEIIKASEDEGLFAYLDISQKKDLTKFGMKLSKMIDRELGNIKLLVMDKKLRAARQGYMFKRLDSDNIYYAADDLDFKGLNGKDYKYYAGEKIINMDKDSLDVLIKSGGVSVCKRKIDLPVIANRRIFK